MIGIGCVGRAPKLSTNEGNLVMEMVLRNRFYMFSICN